MTRKRFIVGLGAGEIDKVKKAIAQGLTEKLRENPEAFARLAELGLVDTDVIENPADLDLGDALRQFRARLSELAQAEPSVLGQLEIRPLEIMRGDDAPEAESRPTQVPLTVVFSDLEGFTSFTSRKGDIEASALLADHYDAVESITRSRGGRVIKKIGDGHMLSFGEPAAAVMAALDLNEAAPQPLRLRAGAHRGQVVQTGDDLFGHVVNVASRVTDLATGGMTLVTEDVREAAGRLPHIAFDNRRSERLPGLDEEIEVSEVRTA